LYKQIKDHTGPFCATANEFPKQIKPCR